MKNSDVLREIDIMTENRKMNTRIRELAEQAGIKFYPLMIDGEEYDYEDVVMDGLDDLQKFAELIVQECALIGELKEQGYEDYDPEVSVGWYMKQHFGVKE